MKSKLLVFAFLMVTTRFLFGQSAIEPPALQLDFPLFDFPYQIDAMNTMGHGFFGSYANLSMRQSLAITTDVYSAMHFGLKKMYDSLPWGPVYKNAVYWGGTALGLYAFAFWLPFGYPWMAEEYTRSILARNNVYSRNRWYFVLNGVTDNSLADFKAAAPHDFIRMQEAGIEGYILFSDYMFRNCFFYDLHNFSRLTAFLAAFIAVGKGGSALIDAFYGANFGIDVDDGIKNMYKNDGAQETRLLYGDAVLNWAYELFHPDEPYAARGVHPSGDGIARYITLSQLTDEEKQYLILHGGLGALNYASPILFGYNRFPIGNSGLVGNFALHHYFTSFGSDIPVQVLLQKAPFNLAVTWHNYQNYEHYFPAIEAELVDFPLHLGNIGMFISPRVLIGMQPKDQVFKTADAAFLGLFSVRVDFMTGGHLLPYMEFTAKTGGWVAGNESLETNVSVTIGVSARF